MFHCKIACGDQWACLFSMCLPSNSCLMVIWLIPELRLCFRSRQTRWLHQAKCTGQSKPWRELWTLPALLYLQACFSACGLDCFWPGHRSEMCVSITCFLWQLLPGIPSGNCTHCLYFFTTVHPMFLLTSSFHSLRYRQSGASSARELICCQGLRGQSK